MLKDSAQIAAVGFHQLAHVTRAPGNGVVEVKEGLALLTAGLRFFAEGGLEVIHLPPKALFQPQVECTDERGLAGFIPEAGAGQEETQRF